jgi:hypothetical protein
MTDSTVDVDLDALAPAPKRVRLNGKVWKLPGDLPMELFFRFQGYEQRVEAGEDEYEIVKEITAEIVALFQVHQPTLKKLPPLGLKQLVQVIGSVYGGQVPPGEAPPPNRAARRQRKARTTSKPRPSRPRATSR